MDAIIAPNSPILITGAAGFIGERVVGNLLERGYHNLRCLVRPFTNIDRLQQSLRSHGDSNKIQFLRGNLLSADDCLRATRDIELIYHLAAGRGEKSVPDAFLNSVVTTRNLFRACESGGCLKRFVNISSFSVYSTKSASNGTLDETCSLEEHPELRKDAYSYAKVKQDQMVISYAQKLGIPWVIVRPGYVYGPGNEAITGRVGIGSFGIFLHLGGSNRIPMTYVDNCAEAIVLAGLVPGVDNEVFNIVDDELPSSRQFLRLYKKEVVPFHSIYLPHAISYLFCWLWEKYSDWSQGQLPPAFTRDSWHTFWKKRQYTNEKAKVRLGWKHKVPISEALDRYFESCRRRINSA
jgi:nucleoside-diphosphate-sugar epimerase